MSNQRERFEAMLQEFGLEPSPTDQYGDAAGSESVILKAHHGGVGGYSDFVADWQFNDDGSFRSVEIWE